MIGSLKPYPEYKESGVSWLGRIPAHWDVRKLRSLVKSRKERNRTDLPLLSVVREKGVIRRSMTGDDDNHNFIPDDLSNYRVTRAGDLVINKMKAWQGSLGIAPCDGIVSPAYFVFDFGLNNRVFGQTLLRSRPYVGALARASDGVRVGQWDLSIQRMREIEVLLPPADEQSAIVRFLAGITKRFQAAIGAKRKLIALLNEQKWAIIHRAVTRGLDPNVRIKYSGIPWLGDIPLHWEILSLKRVLRRLIDCEHKTAPAVDQSEYRVVRTTGIRHGKLQMHGTYCTSSEAFLEWTSRGLPESGDVMFTREAPAGEACIVPDGMRLCLGQRTVLMKLVKERLDSEYLVHMIYAGPPRVSIMLASQGSTVDHFNMSDIGSLTILLPPLVEQRAVVNAIHEQTADLDAAIQRSEREIGLLREYQMRLTADVVTGQLDVRDASHILPASTEQPELSIEADDEDESAALLEAVTDS